MPNFFDILQSLGAQIPRPLIDQTTPDDPSTLQVNVDEPGYMPPVPNIPAPSAYRSRYQVPNVPDISSSAQGEYLNQLRNRPIPRDPGFINKLISGLAGASTGWREGAGPGLATAEAYRETPYRRSLQTWEGEALPALTAAGYETQRNVQNTQRARVLADIAKEQEEAARQAYTASGGMQQVETGRFNAQTERAKANIDLDKYLHPDLKFETAAKTPSGKTNQIVGISPRSGKVTETGLTGYPKWRPLEELDEMIDRRNQGLMQLFTSIPEHESHAALENAYRTVGYQYPEKYGQFIDKKTGYLKPISEIKSLISDPGTNQLYQDFVKLANQEAENKLSGQRKKGEGYTVRPGVNIGGFEIMRSPEEE